MDETALDLIIENDEPDKPSVIVASVLEEKTVYTFCPPATTLASAVQHYIPKGAEMARLCSYEEFNEAGG